MLHVCFRNLRPQKGSSFHKVQAGLGWPPMPDGENGKFGISGVLWFVFLDAICMSGCPSGHVSWRPDWSCFSVSAARVCRCTLFSALDFEIRIVRRGKFLDVFEGESWLSVERKEKHNQKALESIADWKWETRAFFTPTRRQGVTGLGWSRCTHIGTKS